MTTFNRYESATSRLFVDFANGARVRFDNVSRDEVAAFKTSRNTLLLTGKPQRVITGGRRIAMIYDVVATVAAVAAPVVVAKRARTYDVVAPAPVAAAQAAPSGVTVLIACVSQKADHTCEASQLFVSKWFTEAVAWAKAHGHDYLIMSAQHGLLAPTDMASPYNLTIAHMPKHGRTAWGEQTGAQIQAAIPAGNRVIVLGGVHYRDAILPHLGAYTVEMPLLHKGIGQQVQFLMQDR